MLATASQMILCLLIAALIGGIIGYLLCKLTCNRRDETHDLSDARTDHTAASDRIDHMYAAITSEKEEEGTVDSIEHTLQDNTQTDASDTTEEAVQAPLLLEAPRNGQKDNLTRIKGIGKKIEQILNEAGIYHFDQIAAWTEENIAWVDRHIAFPGRVKRDGWVEQARLLAEGKETEFSKRVDAGEVATSRETGA